MPLVQVYYDPRLLSFSDEDGIRTSTGRIKVIIAEELSCIKPDGTRLILRPDKGFEVHVRPYGDHDASRYGVFIRIEADYYPDREQNQRDRSDNIARRVRDTLYDGGYTVGVKLSLDSAAWSSAD
jgi:hypothetical protein